MNPDPRERLLRILLRVVGGAALLALPWVFAPERFLAAVHGRLGMGDLPPAPVVGYLARSTSAFYALLGGLMWLVSFDLPRHRLVCCYLGLAAAAFGLVLFGVDLLEGMPGWWVAVEGPFNFAFGLLVFGLARGLSRR